MSALEAGSNIIAAEVTGDDGELAGRDAFAVRTVINGATEHLEKQMEALTATCGKLIDQHGEYNHIRVGGIDGEQRRALNRVATHLMCWTGDEIGRIETMLDHYTSHPLPERRRMDLAIEAWEPEKTEAA